LISPSLADGDHVVRYCGPRTVDSRGRITASAFVMRARPVRESFLSVNWLEFFQAAALAGRVHLLRQALRRKLRLSRNGRLGLLRVGGVRALAEHPETASVRVERHSSKDDPSHAGIYFAPEYEVAVAAALANQVEALPAAPES